MAGIRWVLGLIVCFTLVSVQSYAAESLEVSEAKVSECTSIVSRLDRLACFDALFQTPMNIVENTAVIASFPQAWYRAKNTMKSTQEPMQLVVDGEGRGAEAWLVLRPMRTLQNEVPPLLMMSCIDDISRIELVLDSPIAAARSRVSLFKDVTEVWRADDSGSVFSSARGLPAIRAMKRLSTQSTLSVRADQSQLDGYVFDLTDIRAGLSELGDRCGWEV